MYEGRSFLMKDLEGGHESEFLRIPPTKVSLFNPNHGYPLLSRSGAKSVPQMITWFSNLGGAI